MNLISQRTPRKNSYCTLEIDKDIVLFKEGWKTFYVETRVIAINTCLNPN